jgi:hypothetical protein
MWELVIYRKSFVWVLQNAICGGFVQAETLRDVHHVSKPAKDISGQ